MNRGGEIKRKKPLGPGAKSLERGTTFDKPRSELAKVSPRKAAQQKGKQYSTIGRRQPQRDWSLAREKVDAEGRCRFCGRPAPARDLEACHVVGRDRDRFDAITGDGPLPEPWLVEPDRIVPGHRDCHREYDLGSGRGLLGKLTLAEELQAVRDCYPPVTAGTESGSGISQATRRLDPESRRGA